ncbi:GolD/DthD family dehydrogenase [Leifsonia naganoensis]|uniref:2-deoxy-D-gluconate 3-dehydrogenase n=1 Tax=Leifsonia naganoensis TaxID=150025 RepID=A0A853DNG9_9MICO|nr:D-threitol dehydrogenase [Leifsonia naganoensis]NYK09049.1 2-deoxy-D-gluconate 3-dehydrogenase [Leifsonia naganoensis]
MDQTFSNAIIIVTGAASGIGNTVARHFAERGALVAGVDLSDKVKSAMAELPGTGHLAFAHDLTDPEAATGIVDAIVRAVGAPTILVNSAGVALNQPALEVTASRWRATLDVNLSASFYMAQAAARVMVPSGYGRIINIASQAAIVALPDHAAYAASKAGILGLTRVLALEWARSGVTVNAISPTIVETPMAVMAWSGEKGERARADIPVGRFAKPEEVASLVAYLASADAGMVTGENVVLDGGYSIA